MLIRSHPKPAHAPCAEIRGSCVVAIAGLLLAHAPHAGAQRTTSTVKQASSVARAGNSACDTAWTPPRELRTPRGQRVYVESGVSVVDGRGRYLIGTPTFVWADRDSFVTSQQTELEKAAGVKLVGEWSAVALPALPGSMPQYTPLPVADDTSLLALWATSRDTTSSGFFNQDTLWESRLMSDRWSTPRAIWSSGELSWHPGTVALTTVGSIVVAAFPARDTTTSERSGIVVMQRRHDGWRTTWIGTGQLGVSAVALLPLGQTELLIVATGGLHRPPIDVLNAVYAIRISTTDTVDRSRFSFIRKFEHAHGVEPSVFRSSRGVHAVWRQPGIELAAHDSIVEATSVDSGARWTVTSTASLETNALGLSVRPLDDGDGVAAALDIRRGMIIALRRAGSRWRLTEETFSDARTMPTLSRQRDRVAVMFARTARSLGPEGPYDAPVLFETSRALRCEAPPANRSRRRLRAPPRGESP